MRTIETSAATTSQPRNRLVLVFLLVLLLAPLFGGIPALVLFGIGPGIDLSRSETDQLQELGSLIVLISGFSYLFGGLSALVSAIWIARITAKGDGFSYRRAAFIAFVSVLPVALPTAFVAPLLALLLVISGAFSAVVCRFLLRRLGLVR